MKQTVVTSIILYTGHWAIPLLHCIGPRPRAYNSKENQLAPGGYRLQYFTSLDVVRICIADSRWAIKKFYRLVLTNNKY